MKSMLEKFVLRTMIVAPPTNVAANIVVTVVGTSTWLRRDLDNA